MNSIEQSLAALRALAIDMVNNAGSGHPGAPMGMAELMYVLWNKHLKHSSQNPYWFNRDRFVLSNGHASAIYYIALHLSGYDLKLEDLKSLRQLNSRCPAHPERNLSLAIEVSTGPLGQGFANSVGLALAEHKLAIEFNKPEFNIINNYTYCVVGDGCLMEGISHEAAVLAASWKLHKLVVLFDSNNISIDGSVSDKFADNVAARFDSYGWNVIDNIDGHDVNAIDKALIKAKSQTQKPSLIICNTLIAKGSPNLEGSSKAHGSPLGIEEAIETKKHMSWTYNEFLIPKPVYDLWTTNYASIEYSKWFELFEEYASVYKKEAICLLHRAPGILSTLDEQDPYAPAWAIRKDELFNAYKAEVSSNTSTRLMSQVVLKEASIIMPAIIGGSADLRTSNGVNLGSKLEAQYIHYGVREFGAAAITNGIAAYGGYIPYFATFLVFSDYAKSAIRMAAMMKIQSIYVFTHDSVLLGEDGPSHQPVEQLSSLRLIPGLDVWRPYNKQEVLISWDQAINNKNNPTAIILSRQNVIGFCTNHVDQCDISKGGYVLSDSKCNPVAIIIATGSEIDLALSVQRSLELEGKHIRVVSMPSVYAFNKQSKEYKDSVLLSGIPVIAVEAGSTDMWYKYAIHVLGIDEFGASGKGIEVYNQSGLTLDNLSKTIKKLIK